MQYGFFFDNTRCTGCKTCEMACKDYKDLDAELTYRRVIDYEGGSCLEHPDGTVTQDCFSYHISLSCNHCNAPECVHVCPTGAMHKDERGLVWPDVSKCVGCGYCTMACPYHAPRINQKIKKSSKCDGCTDRVSADNKPICVEACPLRALDFDTIEALEQKYSGCTSSILPLADESQTRPNLLIKPSPAALRAQEIGGGHIANYKEI
ncbi:MAG: 4Fe-4S dicluster domain-containing protein [Gordonibacter sp.]